MIAHSSPVEHSVMAASGCLAVAVYAVGWLRRAHPSWQRLAAWAGGVVVLLLAVSPPLERRAAESFTWHMAQHLGVIVVASPLLVWSRPMAAVGQVLGRPRRAERWVVARWRRSAAVVAPVGFLLVMFVTHLTPIYDAALRHRLVHDVEHAAYLAAAIGLWSVVLAPVSAMAFGRVGAAFGVIAGGAVLGLVLTGADRPLVDSYVALLGRDEALRDQRQAASLMWVGGMALGLPLLMVSVWRWAATEQRTAERSERLLDERFGRERGGIPRSE